jgi:hypothetical protein
VKDLHPESTAHKMGSTGNVYDSSVGGITTTVPGGYDVSETVYVKRLEEENVESSSLEAMITAPLPSKRAYKVRGKTVGRWALDRRRIANTLFNMWSKACEVVEGNAFAVRVDEFVTEADRRIPEFRGIPYEEVFSGILQLVRDAVTGISFRILQKKHLEGEVTRILQLLVKSKRLDLQMYDEVLGILMKSELLPYGKGDEKNNKGDV